eukprot:Em0007g1429a
MPYSSALAFALTRTKLSLPYRQGVKDVSPDPNLALEHRLAWCPFVVPQTTSYLHLSTNTHLSAGFKKGHGDLRNLMTGLNKMGTYYHQTYRYLAIILRLFRIQLCQDGG